jgi:hypothetical protein
MPAPSKGQLEPIIKGLMTANNLRGENAPDLAGAMADVIAQALTLFTTQVKVQPGIPCAPGASAGPGKLL